MLGSALAAARRSRRNLSSRSGGILSSVSPQTRVSIGYPSIWGRYLRSEGTPLRGSPWRQAVSEIAAIAKTTTLARAACLDPSIISPRTPLEILTRTSFSLTNRAHDFHQRRARILRCPARKHHKHGGRRNRNPQSMAKLAKHGCMAALVRAKFRPPAARTMLSRQRALDSVSPIAMASFAAPATMPAIVQDHGDQGVFGMTALSRKNEPEPASRLRPPYASVLDLIGQTPMVELTKFDTGTLPAVHQARKPEPRRLDQGPHRAVDDRGGRARRAAEAAAAPSSRRPPAIPASAWPRSASPRATASCSSCPTRCRARRSSICARSAPRCA